MQVKRLHVCCKYMLNSEKWTEMPAQIAFDLLQFMQVSHILICFLLTPCAPPLRPLCEP